MNINNNYNDLKSYYNNVLNKDKSLVKTSNDEPTPINCVEEMIEKIPKEFWKRKKIKLLDPCCGCGNFFLVIYKLYFSNLKSFYFNDLNTDRIKVVKNIFNNSNVTNINFLEYPTDEKFDLIVANPPYAKLMPNGKRASKNHNLIGKFLEKSLNLLKPDGYLVYITPDNWMSYADRNKIITKLTNLQFIHLNIHTAKKYFKNVGSSFTWYIIKNSYTKNDFTVEGVWKKKFYSSVLKNQVRNFIPLFYTYRIQCILNKTIENDKLEKFKIETTSFLHKHTKKDLIQKEKDNIFKYKLIHTLNQTFYSKKPHKYQEGYKVFISTTSYYKTKVDDCGMTQSIAFIRTKDKTEAENISKVLNHPLYIFINNICRWGNFNNIRILQSFPYCNDYNNVFSKFGITKKEQNFIMEN